MRRVWRGSTWLAIFLAGAIVRTTGAGWFLRRVDLYEQDLFRLGTVAWEFEEAMEQYARGDAACAAASLEHLSSILRFYVEQEGGFVFVPGRNAYSWDLAITYERLARLAERQGATIDAETWRTKALDIISEIQPGRQDPREFVSELVTKMDDGLDVDREFEEFGFVHRRR